MGKGIVTAGFLGLLALAGCKGEAGTVPEDIAPTYKFDATVVVNPVKVVANQHVSFNLEVTSASTAKVKTDVLLKVVSADGDLMYQSEWTSVLFHENEVWNLTQGFLPDSDAAKKAWSVEITVRNHDTGEVLYDQKIANLDFAA